MNGGFFKDYEDEYGGPETEQDDYSYSADYEDTDESVLSEVEERLAKANCYRALLESELFREGDELAQAVEAEVRGFVRGRLSVLMGMRAERNEGVDTRSPFTEEEVRVLKTLAAKVIAKPSTPSIQPVEMKEPPKSAPQPPKVQPTILNTAKPKPKTPPAPEPPRKRGPGRPKGAKNKVQRQGAAGSKRDKRVYVDPSGKEIVMDFTKQVRPLNAQAVLPMPSMSHQNSLMAMQAGLGVIESGEVDAGNILGGALLHAMQN